MADPVTRTVQDRSCAARTGLALVDLHQVLLPATETGLGRDSKAQAEQVRSIAVERVGDRLGVVPNPIMLDIEEALRLHLGL